MQKNIRIGIGKRKWDLELWQLIFLVDSVKQELGVKEAAPGLQELVEDGGAY